MEARTENSHLKGQAVIALAAAVGVIAASRLSRTGLALAGGLAWHWWNRRNPKPPSSADPETSLVQQETDLPPVAESGTCPQEALPPSPPVPEEPVERESGLETMTPPGTEVEDTASHAWDDLRAALQPTLAPMLEDEEPAQPETPEAEPAPAQESPATEAQPPAMPDFHLLPPTAPLIEAEDFEDAPSPSPEAVQDLELEADQPDFLIDPVEAPSESCNPADEAAQIHVPATTTLLPRSIQAPSIVPRHASGRPTEPKAIEAGSGSQLPDENPGQEPSSSTEVKKNFFDWLRN